MHAPPLLCLLFQPREEALAVVHPLFKKLGPLWLNRSAMLPTSGMDRCLRRPAGRPASVCILFQRKRCTAGALCNQIHVQQHYMKRIHNALQCTASDDFCCDLHRVVPQKPPANQCKHFELCGIARDANPEEPHRSPIWISVPGAMTLVAQTAYWKGEGATMSTSMFHTHRVVPLQDVCQRHQRGGCECGVDCKQMHLCRRVWLSLQATFHPADADGSNDADRDDDNADQQDADCDDDAGARSVTPWTMIGLLSDVLVGV